MIQETIREEAGVRREKQMMSKIIAGVWDGKTFVALDQQPPTPITVMAQAVMWAKNNVKGTVHFMRLLPEGVVITEKTEIAVNTTKVTV
jgi:hypothetical protein